MTNQAEPDHKGPGEFFWFALEFLPDEFWLISIAIGVVFVLIGWIAALLRTNFGE